MSASCVFMEESQVYVPGPEARCYLYTLIRVAPAPLFAVVRRLSFARGRAVDLPRAG